MKFKKIKAFTLLELLIYSGILVVSAGLVSGIVYTISRANMKTQVNDALSNQLTRFEEVFRQKIQIAKSINSISGSLLSLEMSDANKNPTIFTLSNDVVYIQEGKKVPQFLIHTIMRGMIKLVGLILLILEVMFKFQQEKGI